MPTQTGHHFQKSVSSPIWGPQDLSSLASMHNQCSCWQAFLPACQSLFSRSGRFSSVTQVCLSFATPWTTAYQASLSINNYQNLIKLMSIESVMPSNHLILCHPLLLLPSIFSSIRVFSNKSVLHIRWPKYWSFSFNISAFKEYSGLISFRMNWLNLLALQGALKSLLQHHSSKASILQCSALFIVQVSHPYMTTGKTIALTQFSSVQSLSHVRLFATP